MLKIVFPVCCGIDVHKKFIVATIASTDNNSKTSYKTKRYSTFTDDLINLANWLSENNCKNVCMESTGKYWIPVNNVLESTCKIVVANPKYIKAIPGKKTDKKDSVWIADLHKHNLVKGSFIPPKDIRELRDLLRYRVKLVNIRSGEKNRLQNSLTVSNIMLASVVSDTFGKSSKAIIRYMMEHPDEKDVDFTPLLHSKMVKNAEIINNSTKGSISKHQNAKMSVCLNHFDYINECITQLDLAISLLSSKFQSQIQLLETSPGITQKSATAIISEIGVDMSVFPSSKHLCSWAGLVPQNNESAGKKKSVKISRAGVYIKPLLIQCANAAIKSKDFPYFRFRYDAIKRRRGHKRAIIAISRILLTCIYNMLVNGEEFNKALYEQHFINAQKPRKPISVSDALECLLAQGYSVVPPVPPSDT